MHHNDTRQKIEGRFRLCHQDELAEQPCLEFRLGEGDWPLRVFLVKTEGEIHAFRNVCPHAGLPLNFKPDSFLTPDGSAIICSVHGAMFEKTSGECLAGPCFGRSLLSYPVEITGEGQVCISV
ncbi:MAG: Rieske (2Fe-2S) protein [Pseudomonadota bacterium]